MDDIIFQAIKLAVMLGALLITRYVVPWIKKRIKAEEMNDIEKWAKKAVLKAQQVFKTKPGDDKKAYVTKFLKELLIAKNIALSDEQLDILIEAAVKQMKMEEGKQTSGKADSDTGN